MLILVSGSKRAIHMGCWYSCHACSWIPLQGITPCDGRVYRMKYCNYNKTSRSKRCAVKPWLKTGAVDVLCAWNIHACHTRAQILWKHAPWMRSYQIGTSHSNSATAIRRLPRSFRIERSRLFPNDCAHDHPRWFIPIMACPAIAYAASWRYHLRLAILDYPLASTLCFQRFVMRDLQCERIDDWRSAVHKSGPAHRSWTSLKARGIFARHCRVWNFVQGHQ